jgi:predicted porin
MGVLAVRNGKIPFDAMASGVRGGRRLAPLKHGLVFASLLAATGLAHAQSAPAEAAPAAPKDDSLTFHGITLYGIVDIGIQNQTHGAPISDYYPGGGAEIVQRNSNHSVTGVAPSNMSNSRIGLQGVEPIIGDWSGVFRLETFFNPQSGQISDALKSLVQNNGRSLATQNTNVDSSASGQTFIQSYAGFSSKTYGTFTFGRQNTTLADGIAKYDPNFASQAFSLIGVSGVTAGGGDTQNRRLDSSVKYVGTFSAPAGVLAHLSAQYKFNQATGSANSAVEVSFGGEYAGLSVDAFYTKIKDAVAISALSAAQVAGLPALCPNPLPAGGTCVAASPTNALSASISDNTAYALMGLYNWVGVAKFYAGYERIRYANPSTPLSPGFSVSGYTMAYVTNTAFPTDKTMQVFWGGVRYSPIAELDLVGAYYGYKQNSYGVGANFGCTTNKAATCSGTLDDISFDADYRLSKRFDAFAGVMYTGVHDGLANGYLFHTTDITTTIGVRFKF